MWVGPPACCFHGLCIHHRSDASPPTEQEREENTLNQDPDRNEEEDTADKAGAQSDFSVIFQYLNDAFVHSLISDVKNKIQ